MKIVNNESGQTIVVFAVFMGLVALGFLGFAVDAGYLMHEKRMVQAAADAAAVAAAEEVAKGTSGNEQAVANAVAKLNGFDTTLATNPAVVTFPTPTGNFTGTAYVSVKVSKPIQTFFMGAFSSRFATQTVSATATAGSNKLSSTCVCLAGTSGTNLTVNGASHLTATGCGIVTDSSTANSVSISGSGMVSTLSLGISSASTSWTPATMSTWYQSGQIDNSGSALTLNGVANSYYSYSTYPIPQVTSCAPAVPAAITPTGCVADPTNGGSSGSAITISPGCYNSLVVGGNGRVVTLNPGIYVITGNLHFESGANGYSNLGGNGVFIYLTSTGSLTIDNGANVNLVAGGGTESSADGGGTAPSVGAGYDGIAIYQASGNTTPVTIQGGSNSYIGGAIYAPSAPMSVGNGSAMTYPVGGIYATSLTMVGGTTLSITQDSNEGSVSMGGSPKLLQ